MIYCDFWVDSMLNLKEELQITAVPLSNYANGFFHSADGNSYIKWSHKLTTIS